MAIFTLTEKAVVKVKELNKESKPYLRVAVTSGGCSGFAYQLGFVDEKEQHDTAIEQNGVSVLLDAKSLLYIAGTELDYKEDLMGQGFVFKNPVAKSTCGCGESFSA